MMKKILILIAAAVLFTVTTSWAAPQIEVELTAEVDLKEIVNGKEVIKRVPAKVAAPGQIIYYTLIYSNKGDQPATDVKLDDPIPSETTYVSLSAFGAGAAITYSADGGKTFQEETRVTYKIRNADGTFTEKSASPDQYTNIRWTLKSVPAGFTGTVGFKARVQ